MTSALSTHASMIQSQSLAALFAADPARVGQFTLSACGLYVDTAKQMWTAETLDLLHALAASRDVARWIEACCSGQHVNTTEDRPALHTALRAGGETVSGVHARMRDLVQKSDKGTLTGQPVETIIHIGTGGSALGPQLVIEALSDAASRPASNMPEESVSAVVPILTTMLRAARTASRCALTPRPRFRDAAGGLPFARPRRPGHCVPVGCRCPGPTG